MSRVAPIVLFLTACAHVPRSTESSVSTRCADLPTTNGPGPANMTDTTHATSTDYITSISPDSRVPLIEERTHEMAGWTDDPWEKPGHIAFVRMHRNGDGGGQTFPATDTKMLAATQDAVRRYLSTGKWRRMDVAVFKRMDGEDAMLEFADGTQVSVSKWGHVLFKGSFPISARPDVRACRARNIIDADARGAVQTGDEPEFKPTVIARDAATNMVWVAYAPANDEARKCDQPRYVYGFELVTDRAGDFTIHLPGK